MLPSSTANPTDCPDQSVNAATFDAMLRRLQLGDVNDAARSLDAPARLVTDWRSGKKPVPAAITARMFELAAVHMELANTLADTIFEGKTVGSGRVVIDRFVDEAQYDHVGPIKVMVDGGSPIAVPYHVHLASILTAADVLNAAGVEIVFNYLDVAQAERMQATRFSGVSHEQALTTH